MAAVISLEVGQIGRLLAFLCRHQLAVRPEKVVLLLDGHMVIVLGAIVLEPDRAGVAAEVFQHRPRPGERIVDDGDFDLEVVLVGLVKGKTLLDDGLVVLVQGNAAALEHARGP